MKLANQIHLINYYLTLAQKLPKWLFPESSWSLRTLWRRSGTCRWPRSLWHLQPHRSPHRYSSRIQTPPNPRNRKKKVGDVPAVFETPTRCLRSPRLYTDFPLSSAHGEQNAGCWTVRVALINLVTWICSIT